MAKKKKDKFVSHDGGTNWNYAWEKKSYGLFQNEMTGTTAVLGRDKDIEIAFEGDVLSTVGNKITFPQLDLSLELDEKTLLLCRGYVDHETAKIRFSDRKVIDDLVQKEQKKKPLLVDIFQAIESVRVEERYTEIYPGSIKNLTETAKKQVDAFSHENKLRWGQTASLEETVAMALAAGGRKNLLGYFGFQLGDAINYVDRKDRDKVLDWIERIADCDSTAASADLAQEIFSQLDIPEKQEKEEETEGKGPSKKKGGQFLPGLSDIVGEHLSLCTPPISAGSPLPYKIFTTKYDLIHHWSDQKRAPIHCDHWNGGFTMKRLGSTEKYMQALKDLGPIINVARRKLELMIAAQRRVEWNYIKERGKIDSKRLAAAVIGDPAVFKIKENAPDIDTAISIVIDLSGSMRNGKLEVALDTAIVLFECLSKIGIPFEVIGFDCDIAGPNSEVIHELNAEKDKINKKLYARVEGLHTYVFKSFKDRPFEARQYLLGIMGMGKRNNADGESLLVAHQRLLVRPEKRKIMFVLSDGLPECYCASKSQQNNYLNQAIKDIEAKGTHLVGIGILTEHVKHFYPKYAVCNSVKDLASITLKVLSDILLPKKSKA